MAKKSLEQELYEFFEEFPAKKIISFIRNVIPLFELYDIDDENDWVEQEVGEEDLDNVRLVRTAYLLSKIAESSSGSLCFLNVKFKGLWKRIEKESESSERREE